MKNLLLFFMLLSFTAFGGCEKERLVNESDIPTEITEFVKKHFPDNTILQCVKEYDDLSYTYDVFLKDGIKLEFNRKKEVQQIESPTKLPDSVIPEKLLDYVKTNYADQSIVKWEKDKIDQEIKLTNGVELVFTLNGDFLRIDD